MSTFAREHLGRDGAAVLWPVIKAYAEGATVQYCLIGDDKWFDDPSPLFTASWRYRVKPEEQVEASPSQERSSANGTNPEFHIEDAISTIKYADGVGNIRLYALGALEAALKDIATLRSALASERAKAVDDFRMDELDAVMVSVDKWFDEGDPRLKQTPANRAADAREIALKAIEVERAKLIKVTMQRDREYKRFIDAERNEMRMAEQLAAISPAPDATALRAAFISWLDGEYDNDSFLFGFNFDKGEREGSVAGYRNLATGFRAGYLTALLRSDPLKDSRL